MQTQISMDQPSSPLGSQEAAASANGLMRAEKVLGLPVSRDRWSTTLTITPEKAAALLLCESEKLLNRPIRPSHVREFRLLIQKGRLRTTHQGMAFNTRGELADGRHRLTACVQSNTPIVMQCSFNQDEDDFMAYDRGASRSVSDDLFIMKMGDAGVVSVMQAAGKLLFNLDEGRLPWISTPRITAEDVSSVAFRHPGMMERCHDTYHHRGSGRMPPAPAAAFFTLFYEVDAAKAAEFLEQIRIGADIDERSPAMVIRNCLGREASRKNFGPRSAFMVRLVHGWNNHRAGRKVTSLVSTLRDGKFPEVSGYKPKLVG